MKRTKIICTMGPAVDRKTVLRAIMKTGMDIARFNFSHGTHEEHQVRIDMVKNLREELNIQVALLLDTKGPEIRTGLLKDGKKVTLTTGQEFVLTTEADYVGDEQKVSITYEGLPRDVQKGSQILVDDGLIALEVQKIKSTEIVCRVLNGGELGEHKGVNVPNVRVRLPGMTDKDREDLLLVLKMNLIILRLLLCAMRR